MFGKRSDEYKAVVRLYKDGKITAEQRDSLLAALDESEKAENRAAAQDNATEERACRRVTFKVYGMEDPLDASKLCSAVAALDGVDNARADVKNARITVDGDFDPDAVKAAVKKLGFNCAASDVDYYESVRDNDADADDEYEEYDEDDDDDDDDDDDEDEEDEEDDDESTEIDIHVEGDPTIQVKKDGKSLGYFFSDLGEKIASVVNKGVLAAENAGDAVARAFKDFAPSVTNVLDSGVVVSKKYVECDAPYETLSVKIKYIGDDVYRFSGKTAEAERLKAQCREVMTDECYGLLCSLFDERFVGKFSRVGAEIFKLTVEA